MNSKSFQARYTSDSWAIFFLIIFLTVIFFLTTHEFSRAVKYEKQGYLTAEENAALTEIGNTQRRVALLALGIFGIVYISSKRRDRLRINGVIGYLVIFFFLWAITSIAWSEDISLSARRLVVLACLWVAALAISTRFSLRQIIFLTFIICSLFLIIGICAEVTLGTFHPLSKRFFAGNETGYRFVGTTDPNQLAWFLGMLVITGAFLTSEVKKYRIYTASISLIAFLFLILTKTRTSTAATLMALFVYYGMTASWPRKIVFVFSSIFIFCFIYLMLGDELIKILQYSITLGRLDNYHLSTLSGRIPLWIELGTCFKKQPIFGYGYGAFWTPKHCLQYSIGDSTALNGYIDLVLSIGIIGTFTYVLILVFGIRKSIFLFNQSGLTEFAFICAILIFHAIIMFFESMIFIDSFPTFIVICLIAKLGFGNLSRFLISNRDNLNLKTL